MTKESLMEMGLTEAGAINPVTVRLLLDSLPEKAELAEDGSVKGLSDEIAKLAKTEGGFPGLLQPKGPAIPEIFQKSEYVLFVNSHSLYHNFWHAVCDSCLNFAG